MTKLFCVHDSKADAYNLPFYAKTSAEAIRMFSHECKNPDSNLSRWPSDFTLVEVGQFDETSAEMISHNKPIILANASEFSVGINQPAQTLSDASISN